MLLLLLFLLTWTPVRKVCPNHEVVMFQNKTGKSPDLGSVATVNLITSLPLTTCFNRVLDLCFPPCTGLLPSPI